MELFTSEVIASVSKLSVDLGVDRCQRAKCYGKAFDLAKRFNESEPLEAITVVPFF